MSTVTEEPPTQNTSSCKEMPGPVKEHELLQKFVGEWESEGEAFMAPGQPPTKLKGAESSRLIGGFWFVAQIKSTVPDFPYEQILTIGYDPAKKKYIGTVIDSMTSHLWQFEATFDVTGNILTWETEGPVPSPQTPSKFREVTELKSPDHKVFTSSILGPGWLVEHHHDHQYPAKEAVAGPVKTFVSTRDKVARSVPVRQ